MPEPHTIWTRHLLLGHMCDALQRGGVEDARRNAEWMLQEVLGCARIALYADPHAPVDPAAAERAKALIARRVRREPLQYILGHAGFYGLDLEVTPDVLIPRPETEQVVEHALRLLSGTPTPRVLDIGTGSGCIALAIKNERPDVAVHACDVSEAALAVALENAERLRLDVSFFRADVLAPDFPAHANGPFDLVLSNPPYIPEREQGELEPEVVAHEPHLALFSGDDPLLFYRAITECAQLLLTSGGALVFEVHAEYGAEVRALVQEAGFADAQLLPDLAGRPRMVSARTG